MEHWLNRSGISGISLSAFKLGDQICVEPKSTMTPLMKLCYMDTNVYLHLKIITNAQSQPLCSNIILIVFLSL